MRALFSPVLLLRGFVSSATSAVGSLLASSEQDAITSTQALLPFCARLGVAMTWKKLDLHPSLVKTFLGVETLSTLLRTFPIRPRLDNFLTRLASFLSDTHPGARQGLVLLGHMASLPPCSRSSAQDAPPSDSVGRGVAWSFPGHGTGGSVRHGQLPGPSVVVRRVQPPCRTVTSSSLAGRLP